MKRRVAVTASDRFKRRGIHNRKPSQMNMAIAAIPSAICAQAGRANQPLETDCGVLCARMLVSQLLVTTIMSAAEPALNIQSVTVSILLSLLIPQQAQCICHNYQCTSFMEHDGNPDAHNACQ